MKPLPVVLVVDDDKPVARMVTATLSLEGYDVLVAHNGKEALETIDGHPPDAIVLDLQMPVMDGRECFRELRRRGVLAPVVLLSAYGAEEAHHELGSDAFVNKPFDPDYLLATLRSLLDSD